jgi:hypothetical protein
MVGKSNESEQGTAYRNVKFDMLTPKRLFGCRCPFKS